MIAQAVIEEITLPIHALFSGDILLPVLDRCLHSRFARKGEDGVQMIRHEQAQAAMPDQFVVIEFHHGEHCIAGIGAAQLVVARRHAFDRDEKPTALRHPLRNRVRQFFADGQIDAAERSEDVARRQTAR